MILTMILLIATAFISLNGVLYQPKKDPDKPLNWKNISLTGKILFFIILAFSALSIIKSIDEDRKKQEEIANRDAQIGELLLAQKDLNIQIAFRDAKIDELLLAQSGLKNELVSRDAKIDELLLAQGELKSELVSRGAKIDDLLLAQNELNEINSHLIKVMSVADGYNAVVRGVIVFAYPVSEDEIQETLRVLFFKAIQMSLTAENKLGTYFGRLDYSADPEVKKFLRLSYPEGTDLGSRYSQYTSPTTYFYEIRFSKLKILNDQNIQFARMSPDDKIDFHVQHFSWARDFERLYSVRTIVIGDLLIEELGELQLDIEIPWF